MQFYNIHDIIRIYGAKNLGKLRVWTGTTWKSFLKVAKVYDGGRWISAEEFMASKGEIV